MPDRRLMVTYPKMAVSKGDVAVAERLSIGQINFETVGRMVQLLSSAHASGFVAAGCPMPREAANSFFMDNKTDTEGHFLAMHSDIRDHGSSYWVVRTSWLDGRIIAVAKVSPINNICYLSNVAVDPQDKGKRWGSVAVHAALKFGGCEAGSKVVADAFGGTPARNRRENFWGMEATAGGGDLEAAGHALEHVLYATPEGVTLEAVLRNMEKKTPGLASGFLI